MKKGQRSDDSIVTEKLHQIIENIQVIILSAELLKEEVGGGDARIAIQDMINQIINRAMDNTVLISDIRKIFKESSKTRLPKCKITRGLAAKKYLRYGSSRSS